MYSGGGVVRSEVVDSKAEDMGCFVQEFRVDDDHV